MAVDPEFLDIFDLPFIAGDPDTALAAPNGLILTRAAALRLFGTEDVLGKTVGLGGNVIDATVTGVLGEIPEPSHLGNSPAASVRFDIMAPYELYERLREAVNRPPSAGRRAPPAAEGAPGKPPAAAERNRARSGNGERRRKPRRRRDTRTGSAAIAARHM